MHVTTVHSALDIRIFHKEARALADAGFEVTVIGPHPRDEVIDGVQVLGLRWYKRRLPRMTVGAWRAFRLCLSLRADAYHFHDPELLPWMALLLLLRPRVIYDMHENLPQAILTKPWIRPAIRRFISAGFRQVERLLTTGMRVVLAEDSYRAAYPWVRDSITVLNMPRTAELAQIVAPKRAEPTVVYFGAVSAPRGSVNTLQALAQLRKRGIDAHFECVGVVTDPHAAELTELARKLDVPIRVHGYVLPQQGWEVAAQCHVGLALLHPLPNYVDSYPTKLFEYMALGLPVVASDFPLYRQVVDQAGCGLCVDPLDPDALAAAIEQLLSDPDAAAEMGERGRQAALKLYSWDNEAAGLIEFYEWLLQRRTPQ